MLIVWLLELSLYFVLKEGALREATNHEDEVDWEAFLVSGLLNDLLNFVFDVIEEWSEETLHDCWRQIN